MRVLTIPQAFREISWRIERGTWQQGGLCAEVYQLYCEDRISYSQKADMYDIIDRHLADQFHSGGYYSPHWFAPSGEADTRVLAALFLALEAEEVA